MVIAHHLIWTAYGHWLPNDPRGSSSLDLHCVKLAPLGEVHRGRRRVQPAGKVIREFYAAAEGLLKHKRLTFTQEERDLIACGFADVIKKHSYTCYACAVMPDHIHLVIRKHRDQAEKMIERFQDATRELVRLKSSARFPTDHPVWGGPGWKVFLDTTEAVERTVLYVERNPVKVGLPAQEWGFVTAYDGWEPWKVWKAKPQARGRTEDGN
jgi:REP-associated tyrosine transposase